MPDYIVETLSFPKTRVLSSRQRAPLASIGRLIGGLFGKAAARGLRPGGPPFAVYFEKPADPNSVDFELFLPVEGEEEKLEDLAEFGGERCWRLLLRGAYSGLSGAYAYIEGRLASEGRSLSAPPREVYRRGPLLGFLPFGLLTELWFPLAEGGPS